MTDLYDQRIDAMKARERSDGTWRDHMTYWTAFCEDESNRDRLAAYKRKLHDVWHDSVLKLCGRQMGSGTEAQREMAAQFRRTPLNRRYMQSIARDT